MSGRSLSGGASYLLSPTIIFWIFLALLANAPLFFDDDLAAQRLVAVIGILHGVVAYWRDGGARITAPGIYMIASGLFAFFPAMYHSIVDSSRFVDADWLLAVNIALWVQIVVYHFWWEPRPDRSVSVERIKDPHVTRWGTAWGFLLIAGGLVMTRLPLAEFGLDDAAVFVGIVLLSVSIFRRATRVGIFSYLLVAGAVLAYMEFVFTGFGRLRIAALGIAVVVAFAPTWKRKYAKMALLLAIPPVLMYLAADRVQFTATLNPNQSSRVTGLESLNAPFARFAQSLNVEQAGDIVHTWGSSFFASAVAFVPRQLWPDKPVGFGADLAAYFRPELAGSGHSELALFYGEWLWGFGFVGLLIMVPVIGWAIRALDNAMIRTEISSVLTRRNLLFVVMLIIFGASIVDLYWGGTFTFASRIFPRLMILGAVLLLGGWGGRGRGSRTITRSASPTRSPLVKH